MAYFQCTLRILRYIILSLIIQVFAKDDLVLKHHLLASHVFQTIHIDDWLMCVQVCLDEPRCIAYNFKINHGPCELIECGLQDICHRDDSLIYSRGFVFQQLLKGRKVNSLSHELYIMKNRELHSVWIEYWYISEKHWDHWLKDIFHLLSFLGNYGSALKQ